MAAGYRLVIIRVREQSVDGLRRAAVTLERLMGIPERDAFIGLDRLPYPARGSLKLADAQLYIKALRTVGIVAQLEADGTEAGHAPHATAAATPHAPAPPRAVPAPEPPAAPYAGAPPPAAPRAVAPPPAAPRAVAPPPAAPRADMQAPAAPRAAHVPAAPALEPFPASAPHVPRPPPAPPAAIDLSDPSDGPDGSVTRPYPVALVEELVVKSSSETPVHLPAVQPPPPMAPVTEVMPTMSASFVIDLGEAAAPAADLPSVDLGALPPLDDGGLPPLDVGDLLDVGGLPSVDSRALPPLDVGEDEAPASSWDTPDVGLDEPIALGAPAPSPRAPVAAPVERAAVDTGPATDIGLDLALLDEGGSEVFEDLAQQQSPLEIPSLSLDDFDPLK